MNDEMQEALERAYDALCDVRDIAVEEGSAATETDADEALNLIDRMQRRNA